MVAEDRTALTTRRILRWCLQLDRPVAEMSDADLDALAEEHYRWNYSFNLGEGILWFLGLGILSTSTLVPLFISKLTTSTWPLGLVAMIAQGGWFLPQLLAANWTEWVPRRKPVVVNLGLILEQLPKWLMVIAGLVAGSWAGLALVLFLWFFAWREMGAGLIAPAWQDLIARVIPLKRRGALWGLTSAIGTGLGFAGSALSAWLLSALPFPTSFVVIFALTATCTTVGLGLVAFIREPVRPLRGPRLSQRHFFGSLPGLVKQDGSFRRFLAAQALMHLGTMGLGFVAVAAVRRWALPDSTVAIYTGAMLVGQGAGSLVFGCLADRRGHKASLVWGAGLIGAAFVLAWLAPGANWYYVVFLLLGLGLGIRMVSGILVIMEFSEPQRRPTYIGIANTVAGLGAMTGPLLGAWLAGIEFGLVFALSAIVNLAAVITLHWWVREPRAGLQSGSVGRPVG